jgi:hypothetical protein
MSKRHEYSSPFSATGLATASILALIVAMAISVFLDVPSAEASTTPKMAQNVHAHA